MELKFRPHAFDRSRAVLASIAPRHHLKTGVAVCALMMSASALADQAQTVANSGPVAVSPSLVTVETALGIGSSAAINGAGAVGSISVSGINSPFVTSATSRTGTPILTNLGSLTQGTGGIGVTTSQILMDLGNLTQEIINTGGISVTTPQILLGASGSGTAGGLGLGASAQASATGAAASFTVSGISDKALAVNFGSLPTVGAVTQTVDNSATTGTVTLSDGLVSAADGALPANLGVGASAGVGATGAAASISASAVSDGGRATVRTLALGIVTQTATNGADISTSGSVNVGRLDTGASTSVSASGAVTSIGLLVLGNGALGSVGLASWHQQATNTAKVTNTTDTTTQHATALDAAGTSISMSAMGAASVVSTVAIGASTPFNSFPDFANLPVDSGGTGESQTAANSGSVTNQFSGSATWDSIGSMAGTGATVSSSATGASAVLGMTAIDSTGVHGPFFKDVMIQSVTNSGTVTNKDAQLSTSVGLAGNGSALTTSATGAGASIGATAIASGGSATKFMSDVAQTVTNQAGGVVSNNLGEASPAQVGLISGAGASASVTATGAAASLSTTAIGLTSDFKAIQFGGMITQTVTNDATVDTFAQLAPAGLTGNGASASVAAEGAIALIGTTAIATGADIRLGPTGTGSPVAQSATNTGAVSNGDLVNVKPMASSISTGDLSGIGASVGVSSAGAVASIGATAIAGASATGGTFGTLYVAASLSQTATNSGTVANGGSGLPSTVATGNLLGAGTSASIGSAGAVVSLSTNLVGFTGTFTPMAFDSGWQTTTNEAGVNVYGTIAGNMLLGTAASTSVIASGAVASMSSTSIGATTLTTDNIFSVGLTQSATNGAFSPVQTVGSISVNALSGSASAASVGATGATASLSATAIRLGGSFMPTTDFWTIGQTVANQSDVTTIGALTVNGALDGLAASTSVAASGAVAFISVASISQTGGALIGPRIRGLVTQATTNTGAVANGTAATVSTVTVGALSGAGASASLSSTGAAASVTASFLDATGGSITPLSFAGGIRQTVTNTGVVSVGASGTPASLTAGDLSGDGASISIGATGAAASIGSSVVGSTGTVLLVNLTRAGSIVQTATNSASVDAYGSISTGPLDGVGASASASATGVVASLSSSSIASATTNVAASPYTPAVTQTVDNGGTSAAPASAAIINVGTITAGALTGSGSSVSVGSTGAAGSISVSSINDISMTSFASLGSITQTVTNRSSGTVRNTGTISVASLSGTGAGASISATGAATSISYRSVK